MEAKLGDVVVKDRQGHEVALGRFWAESDCLFVFLRHFACPSCSAMVTALLPRVPELAGLGVRVVLVGAGSPEAANAFAARMELDGGHVELVTSDDLAAHRAAELVRSSWSTYGPRSVFTSLYLYALGHWAPRRADDGDVTQQGGVLYMTREGRVAFHHVDRDLADRASLNDVVEAALRSAFARAEALT
jgi:peroxiredoxin